MVLRLKKSGSVNTFSMAMKTFCPVFMFSIALKWSVWKKIEKKKGKKYFIRCINGECNSEHFKHFCLTTLLCKKYFLHFSICFCTHYIAQLTVGLYFSRFNHHRVCVCFSYIFQLILTRLLVSGTTHFFSLSLGSFLRLLSVYAYAWFSSVQFVDSFLRPVELKCIQFVQRIAVKFFVFICCRTL